MLENKANDNFWGQDRWLQVWGQTLKIWLSVPFRVAFSTTHFWKGRILDFMTNPVGHGSLIGENVLPWQPGVTYRCTVKLSRLLRCGFYVIKCICQNLTPGCHGNAFPLLSYYHDTSTQIFHEPQNDHFPKMYGKNCHHNGTSFDLAHGPWSETWTQG